MYWTKNAKVKNLGDYIGEILLKIANIKVANIGSPVYFSVGTVLSKYWWDVAQDRKIIWGSGSCGFDFPNLKTDTVLAVRGPLTRDWLGLPQDIPLGDPALLMPRVYAPPKNSIGPILVVNFHNKDLRPPKTNLNIIKAISMRVTINNWSDIIDAIVASEFVLANSLHASILSHAYGRPWAWYDVDDSQRPLPLRWHDWFAYLDLPKDAWSSVHNLEDGILWWETYKSSMRINNLDPLIDCCPWKELRSLLK